MKNLDTIFKSAKEVLLKQGSHAPQLMVYSKEGNAVVVMADFPDKHSEKIDIFLLSGKKLSESTPIKHLEEVYFISEAWMGTAKSKADLNSGNFIQPSKDPNRIEVLIISARDFTNNKDYMWSYEMIRKDKKVVDLKLKIESKEIDTPFLDAFQVGFKRGLELKAN